MQPEAFVGDRDKLVKTIADTLRKELTIDAPPQRVTNSVNARKTRSKKTTKLQKKPDCWYLQVVTTTYARNGALVSKEVFVQKVILIKRLSDGFLGELYLTEAKPTPQVISIERYYVSGGVLLDGYNPLFVMQSGDTVSGTIIGGSGFTGSTAIMVNNIIVHNINQIVYRKELQRFSTSFGYERRVDSWVFRHEIAANFDNPDFFTKTSNLEKYNIPH